MKRCMWVRHSGNHYDLQTVCSYDRNLSFVGSYGIKGFASPNGTGGPSPRSDQVKLLPTLVQTYAPEAFP